MLLSLTCFNLRLKVLIEGAMVRYELNVEGLKPATFPFSALFTHYAKPT